MKKLLVLTISILSILLTGCMQPISEELSDKDDTTYQMHTPDGLVQTQFVYLNKYIVYDKDTEIVYYMMRGGYATGLMTPYYGKDKLPMTKDEYIELQNKNK